MIAYYEVKRVGNGLTSVCRTDQGGTLVRPDGAKPLVLFLNRERGLRVNVKPGMLSSVCFAKSNSPVTFNW